MKLKEVSKEVGLVLKEKQYNTIKFAKETIPLYLCRFLYIFEMARK